MSQQHHYQDLIDIFDRCFMNDFQTRLIKGDDEPIYLPADETSPWNRVVFAHGFYASGMHEISHWCIAGAERRKQVDFGYWYCPDGVMLRPRASLNPSRSNPRRWSGC
ncbi:hypothetical protein ERHA55_36820 [Erwinia rhapontici]|nr:hypothetical protein ERHA55_36820 [Erwinia rhapontici]